MRHEARFGPILSESEPTNPKHGGRPAHSFERQRFASRHVADGYTPPARHCSRQKHEHADDARRHSVPRHTLGRCETLPDIDNPVYETTLSRSQLSRLQSTDMHDMLEKICANSDKMSALKKYRNNDDIRALVDLAKATGVFETIYITCFTKGRMYFLDDDALPSKLRSVVKRDANSLHYIDAAHSLCAYTAAAGTFEVADAVYDSLTASHPQVIGGMRIRAYVGRLFRVGQTPIGTVCGVNFHAPLGGTLSDGCAKAGSSSAPRTVASPADRHKDGRTPVAWGALTRRRPSAPSRASHFAAMAVTNRGSMSRQNHAMEAAVNVISTLSMSLSKLVDRAQHTQDIIMKKELELSHFLAHEVKNKVFAMLDFAAVAVEECDPRMGLKRRSEPLRSQPSSEVAARELPPRLVDAVCNLHDLALQSKRMILNESSIRGLVWNVYAPKLENAVAADCLPRETWDLVEDSYVVPIASDLGSSSCTNSLRDPNFTFRTDIVLVDHIATNMVGNSRKHGAPPFSNEAFILADNSRQLHSDTCVKNGETVSPRASLSSTCCSSFNNTIGGLARMASSNKDVAAVLDLDREGELVYDFRKGRRQDGTYLALSVSNGLVEDCQLAQAAMRSEATEVLRRLFDQRASKLDMPAYGVHGGGLWIAVKCLKLLGGVLSCSVRESCEDHSWRFHLEARVPIATVVRGTPHLPPDVRIAALDDSGVIRKMYMRTFQRYLSASATTLVAGASLEEVTSFTDTVASARPPFDIVLLDNYLDFPGNSLTGADIAAEIRRRETSATVFIRSANNSAHDVEHYLLSGAHGVVPKSIPQSALIKDLEYQMATLWGVNWCDLRARSEPDLVGMHDADSGHHFENSSSGGSTVSRRDIFFNETENTLRSLLHRLGTETDFPCNSADIRGILTEIKGLVQQFPHDEAIDIFMQSRDVTPVFTYFNYLELHKHIDYFLQETTLRNARSTYGDDYDDDEEHCGSQSDPLTP